MTNNKRLLHRSLILIPIMLLLLSAKQTASEQQSNAKLNEAALKFRRKAGQHDGLDPLEYMKKLRESMASSNGTPTDLDNNPTSVWCLLDQDIINGNYRLKSPNKRCEMKQTFHFSLEDLTNNQNSNLPLTNGTLRVYIQPIKRLLLKDRAIDIQITITARVSTKSIKSGVIIAHTEKIAVAPNMTAQWKEWNITNAMLDCWQNKTNNTLLEVTVHFKRLKCIRGQKKIPLIVADLATFPLNQTTRRDRHWPLQPMVVLFLNDETERKRLREGNISVKDNTPVFSTEETQTVSKRSTTASCKLVNFTVNFAEIRLHHIVYPTIYNARQCEGDCSHTYMDKNDATNHARILASYDYHYKTNNWELKVIPRVPCCVAGGYSPLAVVEIAQDKSISVKYYPDMIATRCQCRA